MRARADAWRALEADPDLIAAKRVADAWCAAFVQPKKAPRQGSATSGQGITYATLRNLSENPGAVPETVTAQIDDLARQYRFFHWHLEFPGIFTVPDDGSADPGHRVERRILLRHRQPAVGTGEDPGQGILRQRRQKRHRRSNHRRDPQEDDRRPRRRRFGSVRKYRDALRQSDGTAHLLLKSGRYPLTGQGDVNTYSVFAETMRTVASPTGTAGILTPTGLATDKTTAPFFSNTLSSQRLYAFYDFENEAKIFRDVTTE